MSEIDVSECKFCNEAMHNEEPYCDMDYEHLVTCKSCPDCYFKQLQQLKQENKKLKEVIKHYKRGMFKVISVATECNNGTVYVKEGLSK